MKALEKNMKPRSLSRCQKGSVPCTAFLYISRLCRSDLFLRIENLFPVAVAGLRPGAGDRIPCLLSSRANPKGEFQNARRTSFDYS